MYFALILIAVGLHGEPAPLTNIDVGLQYESAARCEADFNRASGMFELILNQRYGDGTFHVSGHQCEPKHKD